MDKVLMTRRNFLRSSLIAAGVVVALPLVAKADILQVNKYQKALDLHDMVVADKLNFAKHDAFMSYIAGDDFLITDPVRALADFTRVFSGEMREHPERFMGVPPEVSDAGFALALVRSLCSDHRVPLDPRKVPSWNMFAMKYQELILAA
jgi:hypothetical protein